MTLDEDEQCPRCGEYEGDIPDTVDWIQCDNCRKWYHLHCVNLSGDSVSNMVKYYCVECIELNPKLEIVQKRISKRKRTEINYVALNDGDVINSFKNSSDLIHPFIKLFQNWQSNDKGDNVVELKGDELNVEYAMKTKLPKPIKISASQRDGLGLNVPKFSLDELTEDLEPDYLLEVMNVMNQENVTMTIEEWKDYFNSKEEDRDQILNVLSLEISHSSLGQKISRPKYVEDIDLVDKVWPIDDGAKPKVSKYCLMGIKNSYTDFHLDFAGTSVYYTVLKGSKQFILFPPTKSNLNKFYKWTINQSNQLNAFSESNFLPNNGLENGLKVELNEGDVFIIPSGWIHAVWTPQDTIVIGGNFLTCFNIDVQLKIIDLEIKTKVEKKFKFPNFYKLMVLIAFEILKDVNEDGLDGNKVSSNIVFGEDIDLENCEKLYDFLNDFFKDNKLVKENSIKKSLIGNKSKFLDKFKRFIDNKKLELLQQNAKTQNRDLDNIESHEQTNSKKIKLEKNQ